MTRTVWAAAAQGGVGQEWRCQCTTPLHNLCGVISPPRHPSTLPALDPPSPCVLQEPKKCDLVTYDQKVAAGDVQEDDIPPRQAFCILQLSNLAGVVEVLVRLQGREKGASAEQVVQWKEVRAVDRGPWRKGSLEEGAPGGRGGGGRGGGGRGPWRKGWWWRGADRG